MSEGDSSSQQRSAGFSIRNPRDFWGGLALIALAILALWAFYELPGQRGCFWSRTAPRLFAGVLAVLGAAVAFAASSPMGRRSKNTRSADRRS